MYIMLELALYELKLLEKFKTSIHTAIDGQDT
jgi:hypothetical protein